MNGSFIRTNDSSLKRRLLDLCYSISVQDSTGTVWTTKESVSTRYTYQNLLSVSVIYEWLATWLRKTQQNLQNCQAKCYNATCHADHVIVDQMIGIYC